MYDHNPHDDNKILEECLEEIRRLQEANKEAEAIIASAFRCDWTKAAPDWKSAAQRWMADNAPPKKSPPREYYHDGDGVIRKTKKD